MVVGETGSGKTSTIHALANAMTRCNRNSKESGNGDESSGSSGGQAALPAVQVNISMNMHVCHICIYCTHVISATLYHSCAMVMLHDDFVRHQV
jgi:ABC-type dipeptide/oligopeptide/nickel transport system ATPase component